MIAKFSEKYGVKAGELETEVSNSSCVDGEIQPPTKPLKPKSLEKKMAKQKAAPKAKKTVNKNSSQSESCNEGKCSTEKAKR